MKVTEHEKIRLLEQISTKLLSLQNQKKTLQKIAELTVPALGDYCRIALVDESNQVTNVFAHHSDKKKLAVLKQLFEAYKNNSDANFGLMKIIRTGKPEIISSVPDYVKEQVKQKSPLLKTALPTIIKSLQLTSYMGVPLIAHDRVIGAMALSSVKPGRLFTKDDLRFAGEVAKRIALALDNVSVYQKAQNEILDNKNKEIQLIEKNGKNWSFLAEASKILAGSLDYNETLSKLAHLIVPVMADWCIIDLQDKHNTYQRVKIAYADPTKKPIADALYQHPPIPGQKTLMEQVIATAKPLLIQGDPKAVPKHAHNEQHANAILSLNAKYLMVVPLIARSKTFGTITFISAESERIYTQEDLTFAEQIAGRAALAVDNAQLYRRAQNAITIRDEFISVASHELKTPITTLKLYVEVIQQEAEAKGEMTNAAYFRRINKQINKLTMLVDDLLSAAKISHEKLTFSMAEFSLDEEIKDTIQAMQPTAKNHTIFLKGAIGRNIYGDSKRISQVVTNLLTNAIKYSPDGAAIVVSLTPEKDAATITVQDFGIGIESKHLNKLFTQFYRVDSPAERTYPGLGIGLYIANEIIKRHEGTMRVISTKGEGSQFSFTLPYNIKNLDPRLRGDDREG